MESLSKDVLKTIIEGGVKEILWGREYDPKMLSKYNKFIVDQIKMKLAFYKRTYNIFINVFLFQRGKIGLWLAHLNNDQNSLQIQLALNCDKFSAITYIFASKREKRLRGGRALEEEEHMQTERARNLNEIKYDILPIARNICERHIFGRNEYTNSLAGVLVELIKSDTATEIELYLRGRSYSVFVIVMQNTVKSYSNYGTMNLNKMDDAGVVQLSYENNGYKIIMFIPLSVSN